MIRILLLTLALLAAGCTAVTPTSSPSPSPSLLADNVRISVVAGPVCPVETAPPDPACAPRPLAGVKIALTGPVTVTLVSNEDGVAIGTLPPGAYTVTPQPTELAMVTAGVFELVVPAERSISATATYDTGIR